MNDRKLMTGIVIAGTQDGQAYAIYPASGSSTPASANPLARSRQESQRLQGRPDSSGS